MSTRALLVVLAACAGCDPVVEAIVLDVTDVDRNCDGMFDGVNTISVEGIANDGRCRVRHGCVNNVDIATIDDFEAVMRESTTRSSGEAGPLIDIDLDQTQQIVVNGRPRGCFPQTEPSNSPVLCGVANLSAREDGVLEVELEPDGCDDTLELCDP